VANVRSRFDAIAGYLAKAHGARAFRVQGRLCLGIEGATFLAVHREGIGFRLGGRTFENALALVGSRPWHPIDPRRVAPGWVLVPSVHAWRFERLAIESWRHARGSTTRRAGESAPSRSPPAPGPTPFARPPSTAASLARRFRAALARGFGGLAVARAA
jgi:hypothetical protein